MSETNFRGRNPKSKLDFLEEIILQNYGEVLKQAIQDSKGGFQLLDIADSIKQLTPPTLTEPEFVGSATIMVDGGSVRYKENGTVSATKGLFLNDGDIIEVSREQMNNIEFISKEPGVTSKLQIQYYYSIQLDLAN